LGSVSSLVSEKKIFEISANPSILLAVSLVEYPTGTKNRNFVEDHPRNIHSYSKMLCARKIGWKETTTAQTDPF
jgi:hypothetical protein